MAERPARRRKPKKSVEELKAEINARETAAAVRKAERKASKKSLSPAEKYEQEMKELRTIEARLRREHANEIENLKKNHEVLMQQRCEKVIIVLFLFVLNELDKSKLFYSRSRSSTNMKQN